MDIVCLGLSHHTAPLGVRERVALDHAARHDLIRGLTDASNGGAAREAVVLSTCNRTEIYSAGDDIDALRATQLQALASTADVAPDEIEPHLYLHTGPDAVAHLLRVAAGLDSMVLGEAQILGQVRTAAAEARSAGSADLILATLFKHAVRAGRRARADTDINARAGSVPSAAVELAGRALSQMRHGRTDAPIVPSTDASAHPSADPSAGRSTPASPRVIVVIGAGKMAVLAAHAFGKDGTSHIVVTNRSYDAAMALARQWNGCAVTFDHLQDAVSRADIVLSSTSAPHAVLTQADVAAAMRTRPNRPLVIVDIAVPRDVEPGVADVPGVRLLDVDDLQSVVATNLAERASSIPHVEAIVTAEAERFARWLAALDVTPTIAALRQWADSVRAHELSRMFRRLDTLGPRERELVQALSVALVGKLLHAPVARLKASAGSMESLQLTSTVRELFNIDGPVTDPDDGLVADAGLAAASDDGRVAALVDRMADRLHAAQAAPQAAAQSHARPPRPRDAR
ncbi:MAG: glutamyl-tRNA reductase [Ardenticatenales bacterium]|nr:glutamyl-tRNA reductase [Ardenticatenales bacterium]